MKCLSGGISEIFLLELMSSGTQHGHGDTQCSCFNRTWLSSITFNAKGWSVGDLASVFQFSHLPPCSREVVRLLTSPLGRLPET